MAVPLPALLLAFDAIRLKDQGGNLRTYWTRNRTWLLIFVAVLLATLYVRISVVGVGFGRYAHNGGFFEAVRQTSIDIVPRVWVTYARLLVFPWPLHIWLRAEDLRLTATSLGCATALISALGLTATAAHRRIGLYAASWMLCFIVFVSGFARIQAGYAVVGERFLYLPSLGFCGLMGYVLSRGLEKPRIVKAAAAAAIGAVLLLSVGTVVRNRSWKSNLTLFREAARATPDSWIVRENYGHALANLGFHKEAVVEFQKALEYNPANSSIHGRLAGSLSALGERKAAIDHYSEAVRLKPDLTGAHINLGVLLFGAGRWWSAEEHYRAALSYDPTQVQARLNLGSVLLAMGRNEEALAEFRNAEAHAPEKPEVFFSLGMALAALGRRQEAESAYRAALILRPDYLEARKNLEMLLAPLP